MNKSTYESTTEPAQHNFYARCTAENILTEQGTQQTIIKLIRMH